MLQKLLAIVCSMFFIVACAGKSDEIMRDEVGKVNPGTQMDLEVNVGDRVFFGFDSSSLDSDAQATLTRQVAWLNANPGVSVAIEGHCDKRGTREYNLALGERRAYAVKSYLVAAGVSDGRVKVTSFGKERPAVEGDTADAYAQNRRGVTMVN
jgi:peptidoglycan-associated lipoprotein